MIPTNQLLLALKNTGGCSAVRLQKVCIFLRLNHRQSRAPDVVQNTASVGGIFVEKPNRRHPFSDQCTRQVVTPQPAHRWMTHRLAKVSSHSNRNAHALNL